MLSMFQVVRATSVPLSASPLITPLGSCRQLLGPLLCHRAAPWIWKPKHLQKQLQDIQLTPLLSLAGAAVFHRQKKGQKSDQYHLGLSDGHRVSPLQQNLTSNLEQKNSVNNISLRNNF